MSKNGYLCLKLHEEITTGPGILLPASMDKLRWVGINDNTTVSPQCATDIYIVTCAYINIIGLLTTHEVLSIYPIINSFTFSNLQIDIPVTFRVRVRK
ncbi:uncharacterized protein LAJ45_01982 [Morchella importuna]|uniref:uncharacterized protein n=1 Tax=Morchella importuna TaxID=1174673 RepID=UPI001E8EB777|nr:uncharacterized protein LAJ45_01982 [Morchella importuna]KAH8154214.1 hypothetical protein LAJ45_01982 [Morchella importuna]